MSFVRVPAPLITPDKVWFAVDEYANVEPDPIAIFCAYVPEPNCPAPVIAKVPPEALIVVVPE